MVTNFVNALSSSPRAAFNPETPSATPVPITAASLLSKQIGIYRLSFTLPIPMDPIIPCDSEEQQPHPSYNVAGRRGDRFVCAAVAPS